MPAMREAARGRVPGGRLAAARPLRRTIQRLVEDPLSEKLLWKEFTAGQLVVVDAENGEIAFRSLDRPTEEIDVPPAELAGKE